MAPITAVTAQANLAASIQAMQRAAMTLKLKATWLRQHRSTDPIQQMQTDAIIDLCDAVREIQQAMSGMPNLFPDVDAVREAAAKTTVKSTSFTTAVTGFR